MVCSARRDALTVRRADRARAVAPAAFVMLPFALPVCAGKHVIYDAVLLPTY